MCNFPSGLKSWIHRSRCLQDNLEDNSWKYGFLYHRPIHWSSTSHRLVIQQLRLVIWYAILHQPTCKRLGTIENLSHLRAQKMKCFGIPILLSLYSCHVQWLFLKELSLRYCIYHKNRTFWVPDQRQAIWCIRKLLSHVWLMHRCWRWQLWQLRR